MADSGRRVDVVVAESGQPQPARLDPYITVYLILRDLCRSGHLSLE